MKKRKVDGNKMFFETRRATRAEVLEKHQRMITMIEKTKAVIDVMLLSEDAAASKKLYEEGSYDQQSLTMLTLLKVIDDMTMGAQLTGDKLEVAALETFLRLFQNEIRLHEVEFIETIKDFTSTMMRKKKQEVGTKKPGFLQYMADKLAEKLRGTREA